MAGRCDDWQGVAGEDKLYGGAGANALDGGPGYDVVDPRGPHEEDRFEGHYVQVFLDMRRIADVIYDERHVVVTLEGPGGLVLRELRSLVATASLTGDTDATVLFPIPDAYTEYGLSVTVSGGLIGGSLTFNSSEVNYDQSGVFEAEPFVILSTGHNDGPQGEEPYPGYEPPYVDPPPVIAQNDGSRVSRATDGACRYCTISGGTLEITDPADGVLANDYTVSQFWPHANLTAQLADPPAHGRVTLNPDGTFTYTANPGFWGQDFFRYRATDGQHESLPATVYVQVSVPQELVVNFYTYTPNVPNLPAQAAQWVAHYLRDSATREKKNVTITAHLAELRTQKQLDEWNNKVGIREFTNSGKRYVIVTITVDDTLKITDAPAQGADFRVALNPSSLQSEYKSTSGALQGPNKWSQFIGIILAHEGIYHGIKATHYYNFVKDCACIDAHVQPYNGGKRFSNEASKAIWPKLRIK